MLIQVMYPDNKYDYVKDFLLDELIASRKIIKFRRASGWVTIGVDPVRSGKQQGFYNGIEKRRAAKLLPSKAAA